jgi:alanyl-tRNA synthetase
MAHYSLYTELMQTEKLCHDFAGSEPFKAHILEIRPLEGGKNFSLILDKTIFYPEGGGQPGDRGTINGCALIDIQERDGEILHMVSAGQESALSPGPAELVLDAVRRRDFTVQHSAQHLLSAILLRLKGCRTVSMHLGDEMNTIDLDCPELSAETLSAAEDEAARVIEKDCPYITHLCPPEDINSFSLRKIPPQGKEVIRVVEIWGYDFSPCCGTHCQSAGQIAMLRILGAEKYKGMTRIGFIAGRRVFAHHRMLYENACLISRGLKVPVSETGKGTLALLEKANALERQVRDMENAAAETKARALLENAGNSAFITESYADADIDEAIRIGKAASKSSESVIIIAAEKDLKFAAFCSAKERDIRPLFAGAFEKANGRGGGGPSFFQGQFAAREDLASFLAAVRGSISVQGETAWALPQKPAMTDIRT